MTNDSSDNRRGAGLPPGPRIFRALIEQGLDVLVLADADSRIRYASPSIERALGYKPEELVGTSGALLTHPEERPAMEERMKRRRSHPGTVDEFETRLQHKEGGYRRFEVRAQSLLHEPNVGAIVLTARDVTERRESERRLRDLEERLRLLAENSADMLIIFQIEPTPGITYISPSVERITGYPPRVFLEDPRIHERLIHPEDATLQEELTRIPLEELARPITLRWRHRDGHTIWIEQLSVPVYAEDGRPVALTTISRDVTEKVRLAEELRRAQRMEALGRMAGGMAHDFNNLLTAALLAEGGLEELTREDETLAEGLAELRAALDRGVSLTRQLLTFGRGDPEPARPLDVHHAVRALEDVLRRLLPEDIFLELRLRASRPVVRIGRSQLEQVILNLALNGRDAMVEGGILALETEDLPPTAPGAPARVALRVRDEGVGMDAEEQAKMFEPFFRAKSAAGYGLGLAVVRQVAERTGAEIGVESSPGRGTVITVAWTVTDEPASREDEDRGGAAPQGRGERILVVEDDDDLRRLIRKALSAAGYRVLAAADQEEARSLARDQPIELLVTDLVMPRGNGPELARDLARERSRLGVVYITGYAGQFGPEAAALGDHVLPKPFTGEQLARAVRAALDGGADRARG